MDAVMGLDFGLLQEIMSFQETDNSRRKCIYTGTSACYMGLQTIVYSKIILQILQPASNFEGANSIYGNKIVKTTHGIIAQWASYSIIYGNDITTTNTVSTLKIVRTAASITITL